MTKHSKINYQSGQAMIISVVFFLFVSTTIVFGIASPILKQVRIAQNLNLSKSSFYLAEGAAEDVLYRLKNSLQVGTTETLSLNDGTATTNISTTPGGKIITTSGVVATLTRKTQVDLLQTTGIAFNYGLQAGNGGVTMGGGSTIDGNIYSNGDIDAISASITGSAVAADSASLSANQTNDTPLPPTSSVTFRNTSAAQDFAQSFEVSSTEPINKFQFYIKKVGSPSDATLKIVADNNGSPSTTVIPTGTATLLSGQVSTSYGWVEVVLPSAPSLIPDTTYWVVIDSGSQHASNYYVIGANTAYGSGTAKTGAYSGTWTAVNLDGYFKIFTGGISSLIGGATYSGGFTVGSAGVGDVWATTVKGTSAAGTIYCTTGQNNNKACNTSRGSPPSEPLPFSESNLQDWKDEAEAGGIISGNYTVGSSVASLGPKKITGNLTVSGGGTLTMTGTLWVEGTVTVTSGGKIKLPANYGQNSGTIISDSYITISGGGSLGSGTSGSYLFVVSTSQCPNDTYCSGNSAININGGAGAIAANAQYGNVALSGGASINAVVGNSITVTGGSTVTYEQGLASPSFVSGPSGSWDINSWQEVQ